MSFDLEQVRKAYPDPILSKIKQFTKRLGTLESANVEIETDDLVGLGDVDNSYVLYNDFWNFIKSYRLKRDFVRFDGVDDHIDLGAKTTLWSRNLQKFSLSLWARPRALTTTYHSLFGCADISPDDAEVSVWFSKDGFEGTNYYIGADISHNNYTNAALVVSTGRCDITKHWYHVLVTFDALQSSGNRYKLYVNGILQDNPSNDADDLPSNTTIDIGSGTTAYLGRYVLSQNTDVFNGDIREFKWWNSVLTDTDALNVYYMNDLAPTPQYYLPLTGISSGNPVDSIGNNTASLSGAYFPDRGTPLVPFEPDYQKLYLDLRFEALHSELLNYARHPIANGTFTIHGEPCPASGTQVWYRGGAKRNTGWSVRKEDHVFITQPTNVYSGLDVSQTWFFRVNFRSLGDETLDQFTNEPTGGHTSQTLVEKYDDADSQYFIRVGVDGNVKAGFLDNGVESKQRTANAPIKVGQDHEIAVIFDNPGVIIYVDGQLQTLTTTTEGFDGSTFTTNLYLLSAVQPEDGSSQWAGLCDLNYIDLIQAYDSLEASQTQVRNHLRNKYSISDIDSGELGIVDGCVIGTVDTSLSFTDTSFTQTSYTAG